MVPIRDHRGLVIGFGARDLSDSQVNFCLRGAEGRKGEGGRVLVVGGYGEAEGICVLRLSCCFCRWSSS